MREEIDRNIGNRIRQLRTVRRQPLSYVAAYLGVTPQQVRKYETGQNRASASTIYLLAILFETNVEVFFSSWNMGDNDNTSCSVPASGGSG
ncbi:helix-turn-helix domain-containing protein [Aureimonas ureilytica]|uniref:helix-turn-helix domain-containing protein n=1 Tax=Aureimonas ureilytica TaxID=401562 RepID=UPI001FCD01A3|nr:helix-turn-helix transcriptional regulator [Aureimonas ureilytica]